MSRYSRASDIENELWQMKLADAGRGTNRALVDDLFNGNPPFPKDGKQDGPNRVNTSFLEGTKIYHDAARQYSNAFLRPGNFFNVKTDRGPKHKRAEHSTIITTAINRQMKRSQPYRETLRNIFSSTIVHGIGPSTWDNRELWVNSMQSLADVLIPSRTLLTMNGMDKFAIFRRYTGEQLGKMISVPNVDKALNVPLIKKCMAWARKQSGVAQQPFDNVIYSPERITEDFKENAGIYSSDRVPTINCWDFYFLEDDDKDFGWKRRIVLDTTEASVTAATNNVMGGRNEFLYDSKNRNYASKLSELIHFQFGNGSTVAPFRYHNVRGLGLLLYSVCSLQNRLRCRFTEAVFESMMQFYRTATNDEQEWLIKAALLDKGVLPDGVEFVGAKDRWQLNLQLIQTCMQMNRQSMEDNSSSYTQDFDFSSDKREKTATEVTAEVSSASALVSSMLQEAYGYQEFQYQEICRRFCIKDSKDPDVRTFRVDCLKQGVPEECLDVNGWDIAAERVIGGGNKQMELAQVNLLMQNISKYGPKQQRIILRKFTLAATDDPALTDELAPIEENQATEGRIDAQLATASLMLGLPFDEKSGIDEIGFIEGLLHNMALIVKGIEQSGGMATQQQIIGLDNVAAHISKHIEILSQNPEEKSRVREYGDILGNLMNLVKAYKQRLQEQMEQQAQQQDPEAMAKVEALAMAAKTKDAIAREKHSQSTIQKEEKFRQQQQQKTETHRQALEIKQATVQEDLMAKAAQAEQDMALDAEKSEQEIETAKVKAESEPKEGGEKQPKSSSKKGSTKKIKFERDKKGVVTGATVVES